LSVALASRTVGIVEVLDCGAIGWWFPHPARASTSAIGTITWSVCLLGFVSRGFNTMARDGCSVFMFNLLGTSGS
jgi:hypothetical protein